MRCRLALEWPSLAHVVPASVVSGAGLVSPRRRVEPFNIRGWEEDCLISVQWCCRLRWVVMGQGNHELSGWLSPELAGDGCGLVSDPGVICSGQGLQPNEGVFLR